MISILPIPAFEDNYIWLLHDDGAALVVDPGDATPVINALKRLNLRLTHILITHHHADHIGGVDSLLAAFPEAIVYAPSNPKYTFKHQVVCDGTQLQIANLNFTVWSIPGHTLDHIAYYSTPYLFCGDTLFSAGCGRLFEGTPAQMLASLEKLTALPLNTLIFCTHEYTLKNIHFALTLDPTNSQLKDYQQLVETKRSKFLPSLPSTMQIELAINPFLRCAQAALQQAVHVKNGDKLATFSAIRMLRNNY